MGTDGHGKIVNLLRVSFLFSWGLLIKIVKLPTDTEQLVVACFTDDKLKVIKGATEACGIPAQNLTGNLHSLKRPQSRFIQTRVWNPVGLWTLFSLQICFVYTIWFLLSPLAPSSSF